MHGILENPTRELRSQNIFQIHQIVILQYYTIITSKTNIFY